MRKLLFLALEYKFRFRFNLPSYAPVIFSLPWRPFVRAERSDYQALLNHPSSIGTQLRMTMKLLWGVATLPVRCHFRLHNRCYGDISHPGDENLCTVAVLSSKYSGNLLLGWTRFFLLLLDEKERPARCKSGTYHRYRPILQCYLAAVLLFLLPKRVNKVINVNSITGFETENRHFLLKSPQFVFVFKGQSILTWDSWCEPSCITFLSSV